jgi:hypothetical protein
MTKPYEEDIATAEELEHVDEQVPTLGPGDEVLSAQAQDPEALLGSGDELDESEAGGEG